MTKKPDDALTVAELRHRNEMRMELALADVRRGKPQDGIAKLRAILADLDRFSDQNCFNDQK